MNTNILPSKNEIMKKLKMIKKKENKKYGVIRTRENFIIFNKKNKKKQLNGGSKHKEIGNFVIDLLKKRYIKFSIEQGIYFKRLRKSYVIDILANRKGNKGIAIECGNTKREKLNVLKNYFNIIHISYRDYKTLIKAKGLNENITKIMGEI